MRWAERQRHAFIAERLAVTGSIRRKDLIEKFEISVPQASVDFRRYREAHPEMAYDPSRKCYVVHGQ